MRLRLALTDPRRGVQLAVLVGACPETRRADPSRRPRRHPELVGERLRHLVERSARKSSDVRDLGDVTVARIRLHGRGGEQRCALGAARNGRSRLAAREDLIRRGHFPERAPRPSKPPGCRSRAMSEENVEIVRRTRIALIPLPESAGQRRRSLDERLFVRFPALYRLLGDALMRLPPRSRLRRLMLTRRGGQAYAATNRRDFDSVLVGWDPKSRILPQSGPDSSRSGDSLLRP